MKEIAFRLFERKYRKNRVFVDTNQIRKFADDAIRLLYPQHNRNQILDADDLEILLLKMNQELSAILTNLKLDQKEFDRDQICHQFFKLLEGIEEKLDQDAAEIFAGDPAATSIEEVILCYPGFVAIAIYRIAHEFYKMRIPSLPRLLSEHAHRLTGIEIHPGAQIGNHFVIDHGTGIVIGETSIIGNKVKIYQGVTLGALSVEKRLSGQKRHPTIEDNCVIYSNATILGGRTVIGKNSVVGGNVWLTDSIAPGSVVYHKSEVHMKTTIEAP